MSRPGRRHSKSAMLRAMRRLSAEHVILSELDGRRWRPRLMLAFLAGLVAGVALRAAF